MDGETIGIISQSDYGLHNTIEKDERYWLIDFEYGGIDDISKAMADIVCQPDNKMTEQQENSPNTPK